MNRANLPRLIQSLQRSFLRRCATFVKTPTRGAHRVFDLPARLEEREIFLLKYDCVKCGRHNEEILLASMFQTNLIMCDCQGCDSRYAMADQLEWYRDIASQNPALIEELRKEGKIAPGLVVADFETQMKESLDKQELMKDVDATKFVAVAYNQDTANAEAPVTLLLIEDQNK